MAEPSAAHCPHCHRPISASDAQGVCPHCAYAWHSVVCCPDCGQPLEVLKACGAVDYFCQHGHGLVSRRRAQRQLR